MRISLAGAAGTKVENGPLRDLGPALLMRKLGSSVTLKIRTIEPQPKGDPWLKPIVCLQLAWHLFLSANRIITLCICIF